MGDAARFTYRELAALCVGRASALTRMPGPVLLQPRLDLDSLLWLYALAAVGTPFLALHPQATVHERTAAQALTGAQDLPAAEADSALPIEDREINPEAPFSLMLDHLTVKLSSHLARFKLPRALVLADALPITASGKLDRAACITQFSPGF